MDITVTSIPPAGSIGRLLRIIAGGYQLYFAWSAYQYFSELRYGRVEDQPVFWAVTALGIYLLPWAVNLGFHRTLQIGRQWWFGGMALAAMFAAGWSYAEFDSAWTPVLSTYLIIAAMYAHGHIGISNLIAGIVGLRGCEMRVIPYFLARISGKDTELALCPGLWTPIDRWEAGFRQENH